MRKKRILEVSDYINVHSTLHAVLESQQRDPSRSCHFFATAGTAILKEHFGKKPTVMVGAFALDAGLTKNVVFGKVVDGEITSGVDAFHSWIECDGQIIDFALPALGSIPVGEGVGLEVPRKVFMKRKALGKRSVKDLKKAGDFWCDENIPLTVVMRDQFDDYFVEISCYPSVTYGYICEYLDENCSYGVLKGINYPFICEDRYNPQEFQDCLRFLKQVSEYKKEFDVDARIEAALEELISK